MEDKDKQPEGFSVRYFHKNDWTVPAIAGLIIGASIQGHIEGKTFDVPPQAIGALVTGSIGSTSSNIGPFTVVADTTIDRGMRLATTHFAPKSSKAQARSRFV